MTYTRKSKNQSALPADVKVQDAQGNLLRHRFAEYDYSGRLVRLTLDGDSLLSVSEYGYDDYGNDYQPHAVKRMFDHKNGMLYDMRWDKAGNLGQVSMGRPGEMFEAGRFLFWTEDSRMHAAELCRDGAT